MPYRSKAVTCMPTIVKYVLLTLTISLLLIGDADSLLDKLFKGSGSSGRSGGGGGGGKFKKGGSKKGGPPAARSTAVHILDTSARESTCSQVIDEVWEERCVTEYDEVCARNARTKCSPITHRECTTKLQQKCAVVWKPKCKKIELPQCKISLEKQCRFENVCETVNERVCSNQPKSICYTTDEEECETFNVRECQQVPVTPVYATPVLAAPTRVSTHTVTGPSVVSGGPVHVHSTNLGSVSDTFDAQQSIDFDSTAAAAAFNDAGSVGSTSFSSFEGGSTANFDTSGSGFVSSSSSVHHIEPEIVRVEEAELVEVDDSSTGKKSKFGDLKDKILGGGKKSRRRRDLEKVINKLEEAKQEIKDKIEGKKAKLFGKKLKEGKKGGTDDSNIVFVERVRTETRCADVPQTKCKTVPREHCRQEEHQVCHDVPRQACEPVERCYNRPKQVCELKTKEKCLSLPTRECRHVPQEVCENVQRQNCRQYDVDVCESVPRKVCKKSLVPRPREVCIPPPTERTLIGG